MKYFKYQYQGSMGEVWGLFSQLATVSNEELCRDRRCNFSHTSEIVSSAMNGNLPKDVEEFDLRAYEIKCSSVDEIEMSKLRKKYLTIIDTVNGDEEDPVGYGEISSNDMRLRSIENAFAFLEDNDEFERCLLELYNLRSDYIVDKGVDPVELLKSSLKGIPEAVKSMSEIVSADKVLGSIVETLCENSTYTLQARLEGAFL